ncbi:transcriptional regulator [Chitinophaga horti]|uniref:Transcriptional regulator n=1 Tax=Chitinophaga horti TaxID=2920382 RepID=A0ABY6J5L0_9BACT|nr:metalloregulator ArsR/SmtB family transcription factor [Chitinophaga horti]UYQ94636.1 transcriptional regulator [Chitinophaga horti]
MENYKAQISTAADRFLTLLKTGGPQTASGMAKELGITGEGARLHLLKLQEEGLVEAVTEPKGVGRPQQIWSLTERGNRRFPDSHSDLTVQLINTIEEVLGPDALNNVIVAREQAISDRYYEALSLIDNLPDKLARLAEMRHREGYLAEWRKDGEAFLFIEHHCPICSAAKVCGNICQAELKTFRRIFGEHASVDRIDHLLSGAKRCVYKIVPLS